MWRIKTILRQNWKESLGNKSITTNHKYLQLRSQLVWAVVNWERPNSFHVSSSGFGNSGMAGKCKVRKSNQIMGRLLKSSASGSTENSGGRAISARDSWVGKQHEKTKLKLRTIIWQHIFVPACINEISKIPSQLVCCGTKHTIAVSLLTRGTISTRWTRCVGLPSAVHWVFREQQFSFTQEVETSWLAYASDLFGTANITIHRRCASVLTS